jgi:hypothetical protein
VVVGEVAKIAVAVERAVFLVSFKVDGPFGVKT